MKKFSEIQIMRFENLVEEVSYNLKVTSTKVEILILKIWSAQRSSWGERSKI